MKFVLTDWAWLVTLDFGSHGHLACFRLVSIRKRDYLTPVTQLSAYCQTQLDDLVKDLYSGKRRHYRYENTGLGKNARIVRFNPSKSTFQINSDHEFVREYLNISGDTPHLLQDVVTAEALLEVYLRQHQVPTPVIGEILEQRDELLRSLALDRSTSLDTISQRLLSTTNEDELEIALVVSARALGFVANHVAGSGNPDGVAIFNDYPTGKKKIILEAKYSVDTPSLQAIDIGGIFEHMKRDEEYDGCLLLAPNYPGESRGEESAIAWRSGTLKVSCWTINQLARFVAEAEKRQLHARHLLDIVLNNFSPNQVTTALETLFSRDTVNNEMLYVCILSALSDLDERITDRNRDFSMILGEVTRSDQFRNTQSEMIERAVKDLAAASKGGMVVRDQRIILNVSVEELARRVSHLTKQEASARRISSFKQHGKS